MTANLLLFRSPLSAPAFPAPRTIQLSTGPASIACLQFFHPPLPSYSHCGVPRPPALPTASWRLPFCEKRGYGHSRGSFLQGRPRHFCFSFPQHLQYTRFSRSCPPSETRLIPCRQGSKEQRSFPSVWECLSLTLFSFCQSKKLFSSFPKMAETKTLSSEKKLDMSLDDLIAQDNANNSTNSFGRGPFRNRNGGGGANQNSQQGGRRNQSGGNQRQGPYNMPRSSPGGFRDAVGESIHTHLSVYTYIQICAYICIRMKIMYVVYRHGYCE